MKKLIKTMPGPQITPLSATPVARIPPEAKQWLCVKKKTKKSKLGDMTQMEEGSHAVLEPTVERGENLPQRAIVIPQTPLSLTL